MTIATRILIVAASLAFCSHARALSVTYTDADFTPAWQSTLLTSSAGGHSLSTSVLNVPVNGNAPDGNYVHIDIASGNSGEPVEGFIFDSGMVFDPAGMFEISTIDFSANMKREGGAIISFGLLQNGTYYQYNGLNGQPSSTWNSQSVSLASGAIGRFSHISGTGGPNPDFTADGAPITVGIYTQIAGFFFQNTGDTEFDDFSATINYTPIPEPRSAALFLLVVTLLHSRRRRAVPSGHCFK